MSSCSDEKWKYPIPQIPTNIFYHSKRKTYGVKWNHLQCFAKCCYTNTLIDVPTYKNDFASIFMQVTFVLQQDPQITASDNSSFSPPQGLQKTSYLCRTQKEMTKPPIWYSHHISGLTVRGKIHKASSVEPTMMGGRHAHYFILPVMLLPWMVQFRCHMSVTSWGISSILLDRWSRPHPALILFPVEVILKWDEQITASCQLTLSAFVCGRYNFESNRITYGK